MKANHNGGLLNKVLEFVGNNIPYGKKITPLIKKQGAPIKEHVIPWLTEWLNNELDKVIKGKERCGLDSKTLPYFRNYLVKAAAKKIGSQPLTFSELEDKCKNMKHFCSVYERYAS